MISHFRTNTLLSFFTFSFEDERPVEERDNNRQISVVYSNFDRSSWRPRTNEQHRAAADRWKAAPTQAARDRVTEESGVRYSSLLRLRYFDPVRMIAVDPMHNLLLGTARAHMELLMELEVLSEKSCREIAQNMRRMQMASGIPSYAHKV